MKFTILICDDDEDIRNAVEIYLKQEDYETLRAANGREAVEIAAREKLHLILMDVMMPVMDGLRAAIKIRETSNVPILFLSAKSEDVDRILGFTMGGDDYITKPFNPIEMLARVKAHLRRYTSLGGLKEASGANIYETGGLTLDDDRKRVVCEGEEVGLTAVEFNILRFLMSHMDCVFSSAQIYEQVWNEPAFDVGKIISVHIRHIREKIEINPKEPKYLKVIYGLGYKVAKLN